MGKNVPTYAAVTKHRSVIIYADAYKSQLQKTALQPTTQKLYPRILSKPVYLQMT